MSEHLLFRFTRDDQAATNQVVIDLSQAGTAPSKYFLGSFLEHLGHGMIGGVLAELLVNPTFARSHNLTDKQVAQLRNNARSLTALYLSNGDPAALGLGWTPQIMPTGFATAVLDDATEEGLPFGWGPLGYPGGVSFAPGRTGGAVRIGPWSGNPDQYWPVAEDGPAGIRQGFFPPIRRCREYTAEVWARIASPNAPARGQIEIGLRRRVSTPDGRRQAGEGLASSRHAIAGSDWVKIEARFQLTEGQVSYGEPIDFYVRWLPADGHALLIDRAVLNPADAVDGIDPEIIELSKAWPVPLLRWPGGNFVSFYHWRDGVGPVDLRPTYANQAWGGLEYGLFGTDEFMTFCRHIDAEPHLTVNAGTGTPEEAAAWVEYCNGDLSTPMGRLRAQNGHPEPYDVRIWEVGNEPFGFWQAGFHGSDENARRFAEFARAMDQASPIPLTLIASGNGFDFPEGGLGYDYVTADRRWHLKLLESAAERIDYISLHSMPANHLFLSHLTHEEATLAVLGQVDSWERRYIPELLAACDQATQGLDRRIGLAVTEWGNVGDDPARLHIENFGGVAYGGFFLNLLIRNAERIPIANTTGFMHGGCLRKGFGITYYDPQYLVIQEYAAFIDNQPVACHLTGLGFDVTTPADIGHRERDLPFIDVAACRLDATDGPHLLLVAAVNRHLRQTLPLSIHVPGLALPSSVEVSVLAYPEITARTSPAQPDRFKVERSTQSVTDGALHVELPPFSVTWIRV
ncbi:MAG: hypothetical protein IPK19_38685 [Chloroflexi bacterium]|nr:hypothetical protein [Chloroflexota bacterium]